MNTSHRITEDKPPYRPLGRYVCDDLLTECHLFDTVIVAREFAKDFGKDCNIGWIAPVYDRRAGKNRPANSFEAKLQISKTVVIVDHRKPN